MPVSSVQHRSSNPGFEQVVLLVRHVLRLRPVYLCDSGNDYRLRVYDIRVSRKLAMLKVKLATGWSTVSFGERLVDGSGELLYEHPGIFDFDLKESEKTLEDFVSQLGLLPWCKGQAALTRK